MAHQPQPQTRAGSVRQGTARSVGPQPINGLSTYGTVSSRVSALAAKGSTIYAGAADGGVWKSADAGAHWQALTDNKANVPKLAMGGAGG